MSTWNEFYYGDLQSLWALLVPSFAFVAYRITRGTASTSPEARFLARYTLGWALLAMLDPVATGPLSRALGISDSTAGTLVMFTFVLLGDLRVFALLFGLADRSKPATGGTHWHLRAVGFTLIVPVATGVLWGTLQLLDPEVPGQVMWLIYETAFLGMAIWLARRGIPALVGPESPELRAVLTSCAAYAATYYALWAACDIAILADVDEAWAVRAVPNQLYYGLWVPFVYWRSAQLRAVAPQETASR